MSMEHCYLKMTISRMVLQCNATEYLMAVVVVGGGPSTAVNQLAYSILPDVVKTGKLLFTLFRNMCLMPFC